MRVVHLIAYFQPELGYREYYYSRNLARMGVDVHVVTSDRIWPYPDLEELARSAGIPPTRHRPVGVSEMEGFTIHRLPIRFEYRDFALVRGVREKLAELAPDVVHAYEGRQGMTAIAADCKESLGYRLYYEHEQRWTGVSWLGRLDHFLVRQHGIRKLVDRADLINVCTPAADRFLRDQFPRSADRIRFVPLGADPDFFSFRGGAVRDSTRGQLSVGPEEGLLLTAGKLLPHKRLDLLIDAFFRLPDVAGGRPLTLAVIGSGDDHLVSDLAARARSGARPGRRVVFEPFVPRDRLADYYTAADLGVWTQASITILEAYACGLPLALPDSDSVRHLVADGNGVTWSDWGAFPDVVGPVASDPARLQEMRENALESFGTRFDYRTITRTVLDRYREILAAD